MPTRPRTSTPEIISAARSILERQGLDALTMQAIARAVGVRGPSLYKRVHDRSELLRLIADDALRELGSRLDNVAHGRTPSQDLRAMAREYRAFAHANPRTYALLFSPLPEAERGDLALTQRASALLLRTVTQVAGERDALAAARMVVAWIHGFVSMELAGAFRLGGDVQVAFDYGLERIIAAVA